MRERVERNAKKEVALQYTNGLWLIDGGYIYNAQRSIAPDYSVDYLKLRMRIEETHQLWRAYYLNCTPGFSSDGQNSFHRWLESAPPQGPKIITQLYELKQIRADSAFCEGCGRKVRLNCPEGSHHHVVKEQQKGVDVGLATLALTHQDNYDSLILSSGDSDLLPAIEFLSERRKRIVLVVFQEGVSTKLQSRADEILWVDEFAENVRKDAYAGYAWSHT